VSFRFTETHHNLDQPSGLRLRGFQRFNVNQIEFQLIDDFGSHHASKPEEEQLIFLNKCFQMFYWSNEYKNIWLK
jgi:hypothetical protein